MAGIVSIVLTILFAGITLAAGITLWDTRLLALAHGKTSLLGLTISISSFCAVITALITITATASRKKSTTPPPRRSPANPVPPPADTAVYTRIKSQDTAMFSIEHLKNQAGVNEQEMQEVLASVVFFMSKNFKAFSALGFIYDPTAKVFILNSFTSKSGPVKKAVHIPLGEGIIGRIGTDKHSFMSGDLSMYNFDLRYYTVNAMINSILVVPVISSEQELLGALCIDSLDKQAFNDNHKDTLKRFSILAAALISNVRMRIFQERAALQFKVFGEAAQQFVSARTRHDVYNILNTLAAQFSLADRTTIVINQGEGSPAVVAAVTGICGDIKPDFSFPVEQSLFGFALKKHKSVAMADFNQYRQKYALFTPEESSHSTTGSIIIVPILDEKDHCLGLLSVEHHNPGHFSSDTEQMLITLCNNAAVALIRAGLYEHMEILATTDGLTGLNNHRRFQEQLAAELARAGRYGRMVALILLDIDHFKKFNDTYGHPVGDLVLKEISLCIRKSIRVHDFPARYGGEEFVVILPESDLSGLRITAERIRRTIEEHIIHTLDKELRVTVSIGGSAFPTNTVTQAELIAFADKALYHSKEHGRNRCTLYTPETTA